MFDTLFHNGKIYSMGPGDHIYSALAVKKGRIEAVFDESTDLSGIRAANRVDLNGAVVLPAFIDSHIHFVPTAVLSQAGFRVCGLKEGKIVPDNIPDVLLKIGRQIETMPAAVVYMANNYIKAAIREHRMPYRTELDSCAGGKALIVYNMDGHSCSCSSKALELLGISTEGHDGILEGAENEFIQGKIMELVMKGVTLSSLYKGFAETVNQAAAYGIKTFCCHEGFEDAKNDLALTAFRLIAPGMPLDFRLFIQYRDIKRAARYFRAQAHPRIGGCGSWEMDGSVSSGTAAFYRDYLDKPGNSGQLYYSKEESGKMFGDAIDTGCTVSVHAIGTRAIGQALDTYDGILGAEKGEVIQRQESTGKEPDKSPCPETCSETSRETGPGRNPHRIDHFEFPTKEQVQKAIDLKLNITVQPGFTWIDGKYQQAYHKVLAQEVIDMQVPLKTLYDAGVSVLGSSDGPVQDINPFLQIQGMVDFPIESERLTLYEALKTYTLLPAIALGEERERGSLEPGCLADLVIFDKDVFRHPVQELYSLKPTRVYFGGKPYKPLKGSMTEFLFGFLKHRKKI